MIQAKFSLDESHVQFLNQHRQYGFKDKSELVRTALNNLYTQLSMQRLRESADCYAQVYEEDEDTMQITEAAIAEWPE